MLLKRRVLTINKEREARAGTAGKLRVGAHHLRVGAIINRPRNILALTGQAGLRASPGTRCGNRVRRGRSRRCGGSSRRACRSSRRGTTRRATGCATRGRPASRRSVGAFRSGRGATGHAKTQHTEAHRAQTKGTNLPQKFPSPHGGAGRVARYRLVSSGVDDSGLTRSDRCF